MSEKCEHLSTIVEAERNNVSIHRCTWGCGETLVSIKLDAVGNTITFTAAELATLREENERLKAAYHQLWAKHGDLAEKTVTEVIAALKGTDMTTYKITMTVEGSRIDAVTKKAVEAFGNGARVEKLEIPTSRAKRLECAESDLENAKATVEELRDELQEWYDNLPENLQSGSKADELQEAISQLEDIVSYMENCDFSVNFPGMY